MFFTRIMKYIFYSLIIFLLLSGCSRRLEPIKHSPQQKHSPSKSPAASAQDPSTSTQTSFRLKRLYAQYNKWRGTSYQYGGLSLAGVDCSGFVHQTYKSIFKINLPRSTKDQVKKGKRVYLNQLHAGDLVFFKTGWNVRHVGIYLEKGRFVHASSSKGVIISTLYKGYWKKNYTQARRLL